MTVIAVKNGIMAADTGIWQGGIVVGHRRKIVRLNDRRLFAACGQRASTIACADWLNSGGLGDKPPDENVNEFAGVILAPDGVFIVDHLHRIFPSASLIVAEGAHHEFVMGAMLAGATAQEAVRMAIERGDSAAGEVDAEWL